MDNQIRTQHERSSTLVEQLAYLNDTTVAQESEYRQGQAAVADYRQVQQAKRAAEEAAERMVEKKKPSLPLLSAPEPGPVGGSGTAPKPVTERPVTAPGPVTERPVTAPGPVTERPVTASGPVPGPKPVSRPERPAAGNPGGSGTLTPDIPRGAVNDPAGAQAYASSRLASFGWGRDQFPCRHQLWERESNWRTNATDPYSGACVIAQSLPASKYGQAGADWLTSYRTQVNWGLGYIRNRYGSPCSAWGHSQSVGWY